MNLINSVTTAVIVVFLSLPLAQEVNGINDTTTLDKSYMDVNGTSDDFDKVLSEMKKTMKKYMQNIERQIFPFAIDVAFESDASQVCLIDMMSIFKGVTKLDSWAFRMFDATGKISGGLMEGTSTALGDYDECLAVERPQFGKRKGGRIMTGQYCLLEIKPPEPVVQALKNYQVNKMKTNSTFERTTTFFEFLQKVRTNPDHVVFRMGLCVPNSCDVQGIQSIIDIGIQEIDISVDVSRCEAKEDFYIKTHQILILTAVTLVMIFVLLGTVISCFKTEENEIDLQSSSKPNTSSKIRNLMCKRCLNMCTKFSLCEYVKKLLDCTPEGDAADVIRGLNVLTILFTIFTHTYALPHPLHMYRFRNTLNFTKFIDEILFGAVANSSVGVDTFFFLAGFDFIYNRWRLFKRPNVLRYILKFIVVTYIRMVAIQFLVGCLFFLSPLFGSGPLWEEFVEQPLDNCRNNWWYNLLFIQNFLGPYDICLYQTWILATMMQIFLFTAVILYVMSRWPPYALLSSLLTIVLAMLAVATVTALTGFPATFNAYFYDYRTSKSLWKYLYTQAYTHIGPQCIGMLTAYFVAEYSSRKMDKRFVFLLWFACLLSIFSIVFGLHEYRNGQQMDRGLAVFYAAVHRPAWAIGVGWIVYACATGYGGIINSLLSWKALIPLARLGYLTYILHVPIMYYQGGIQRERMFMGHYNQIMCFLAYTATTFLLASLCYLLFQAPYETVEEWIFKKRYGNIWGTISATVSQATIELEIGKNVNDEVRVNNVEEDISKVLSSRHPPHDTF